MTSLSIKECSICRKPLRTRSNRHYHEHCQNPELKPFKCVHCERTFSSKSHKVFHEESHQERRLPCKHCHKTYQHQRDLDLHLQEHNASVIFRCNKCSDSFSSLLALTKHKKSHSVLKRYKCDQCELTFSLKGNLVKHIKVLHSRKKQFSCDQCVKTFYRNNALQFHMLSHQLRNYQCKTCHKEFVDARNLERHLKTHASLKEFQCDICGISSSRKDNIIRHAKSFHPESDLSKIVQRGEVGNQLDSIKLDARQSKKSQQTESHPSMQSANTNRVSVIKVIGIPKPLGHTATMTNRFNESDERKSQPAPKPVTKIDPLEIYRKILQPSAEDDEDSLEVADQRQTPPQTITPAEAIIEPPAPSSEATAVSAANTNNSGSNNSPSINNFSEVHWRKRTSQIFTNSSR
ncbi:gastrula zinc finger protein XlCGF52.1-like [Sabethes cyaneus]|uniref:gastrula zinc finger protein XlCGF52.1-like n=1 Tax=Sabethes cyaneus TaxID=53552 RepID=UPI00237E5654|nr:gastrula zinc finger protein XlCGF52.1-like [Sabethes cyaneus]